MLTLYLRKNPFSNRKKPYAWRSRSEGRLSHEKLIDAVASANTTVSKADVLAVITEYERQMLHALQEGFSVESFFGTLSVGASGSAEKEGERFNPGRSTDRRKAQRDHKFTLNFKAKPSFLQKLKDGLSYRTERLERICEPQIGLVADAEMQVDRPFRAGDTLHVRGQFLKIDPKDEEQGLFFTTAGRSYRLSRYTRCTRCSIDSLIPDDMAEGCYQLELRTKKGESLHRSNTVSILLAAGEEP